MKTLKIAVVGTGGRAASHLASIQVLSDLYRLAAVCDPLPGRAEAVGAQLGVPGYADIIPMLEIERPDVVFITAPPEFHHEIAVQVAAHGAHVITEVPIAIALPYADAMIEAAETNGVKLEVAENVWRFPEERFKRMLLDSGMLGDVQAIRMHYSSGAYHGISAVRRLKDARAVKVVGMARLMQAPRRRRYVDPYYFRTFGPEGASPPAYLSETDVASWEAGLIEFEDGGTATYEWPIMAPRGRGWELQTTRGWMGDSEVTLVDAPDRRYRIVVEYEGAGEERVLTAVRLYEGDRPLSDVVWENPYRRYGTKTADDVARLDQLVSIYRAATEGISPEYDGREARNDIELLIAVRESARLGGTPINLPLTQVTGYERRLFPHYGEPGGTALREAT